MDFELTPEQRAISESVTKLLKQRAGPARARSVLASGGYDHELAEALDGAGFLDVAGAEQTGTLEAALVVEAVARHAGLVACGAAAIVAPVVLREKLAGPVALSLAGDPGPVRYGAHARTLLLLSPETVRVRRLSPGEARPAPSNFGFPMAHMPKDGGDRLDAGAAKRMLAAWGVALATEVAGTMRAALDRTVDHVKGRWQFGRPIGSFQALQHRLAECAVLVEGARWLAFEAAWLGGSGERADTAASYASLAARRIFHEAHQLHGAMGLTREHDLHLWSMRLPALWIELEARRTQLPAGPS